MSGTGQNSIVVTTARGERPRPEGPARPVMAFAGDFPDGEHMARHRHEHAQIVYASAGLMRFQTAAGISRVDTASPPA